MLLLKREKEKSYKEKGRCRNERKGLACCQAVVKLFTDSLCESFKLFRCMRSYLTFHKRFFSPAV